MLLSQLKFCSNTYVEIIVREKMVKIYKKIQTTLKNVTQNDNSTKRKCGVFFHVENVSHAENGVTI